MARLVLYTLAALATRAYDWTTPDAGLTPFNCTAFPNPIQVLLRPRDPGSSPTTGAACRRRRSGARPHLPSARAVAGAASAGASPCSPGASSTPTTTPSPTSTTTEETT